MTENSAVEAIPKREFDEAHAVSEMLASDVLMLNSHWWKDAWSDADKKITSIEVICNDVFVWGTADAEPMNYEDIEPLYKMWMTDRKWGSDKWCAVRRNLKPQQPVIDAMKKNNAVER